MSIDYGMGRTNIDTETGIRYGVISQNDVMQAWADSSEPVYPEMDNTDTDNADEDCEPIGWKYEDDGYVLVDCLDSDIMVIKSPYYTFADFCSPCVPGAGNLNSDNPDGIKTYCLGHDWFEDGKAPYPVFSIATGEPINKD